MRGQVSAPIELVVAVIILVMSMTLAFYIIDQTNNTKCIAELRSSTQHLTQTMLEVAQTGSAGTKKTVVFEMPACGNQQIKAVRFVYFDNPNYCQKCAPSYGSCWQIVPVTEKEGQYFALDEAVTCVNIPGKKVQLQQKAGVGCEALSESPCPPENGNTKPECPSDKSGVTQAAWNPNNPANSPSRWRTLGRSSSAYLIELENTITLLGGQEATSIQICAKKA